MISARRTAPPVAVAILVAALAWVVPAGAGKGKGGAKVRTFSSGLVNLAIPDDPPGPARGTLNATIEVAGKALKGRRIEDVNVSLRVSHQAIGDLAARLVAPNGANTGVIFGSGGTSWGGGTPDCNGTPLTFDDESATFLWPNTSAPPPGRYLGPPYAGVVRPGTKPLEVMDRGPIRGTWRLTLTDFDPPSVGTLHCWSVTVKPEARESRR